MTSAPSFNGHLTCAVRGCSGRIHGHSLCRRHYDADRYRASMGRAAEDEEAREEWIKLELRTGCCAEWQSPHRTNSMVADEAERREAWETYREELMAEALETNTSTSRTSFSPRLAS